MMHHIRHRIHKHTISFGHAFRGLSWVLQTQPNYIIHLTLSVLAVIFGLIFALPRTEWMIVLTLIFVGLAFETINSALEQTLDCISMDRREDIKVAKDVAAAAMLIFSIGAAIVAVMIFAPYFFK